MASAGKLWTVWTSAAPGSTNTRVSGAVARLVWTSSGVMASPAEVGGPRVIRSRSFVVKPMTVDVAVLEVGSSEDGFLVFRDAATERVTVLYKRRDGNLSLIEPEA